MVLLGQANTNYTLMANTNLLTTNWIPVVTSNSPSGIISLTDTNFNLFDCRFYRAVTD